MQCPPCTILPTKESLSDQSVLSDACLLPLQEIGTTHQEADLRSPDRLSAETVLQDSSLAEGAAGLLAMTSTADRTRDLQVHY